MFLQMTKNKRLLQKEKLEWLEKITTLELRWRSEYRINLLHPLDVIEINKRIQQLKHLIQYERHTKANKKSFSTLFLKLFLLVKKANERMAIVSTILLDIMELDNKQQ